jgi:hypothetical protein
LRTLSPSVVAISKTIGSGIAVHRGVVDRRADAIAHGLVVDGQREGLWRVLAGAGRDQIERLPVVGAKVLQHPVRHPGALVRKYGADLFRLDDDLARARFGQRHRRPRRRRIT